MTVKAEFGSFTIKSFDLKTAQSDILEKLRNMKCKTVEDILTREKAIAYCQITYSKQRAIEMLQDHKYSKKKLFKKFDNPNMVIETMLWITLCSKYGPAVEQIPLFNLEENDNDNE